MYIILPFTVLNGTHLQFISIYHNEHKPCRYECHTACVNISSTLLKDLIEHNCLDLMVCSSRIDLASRLANQASRLAIKSCLTNLLPITLHDDWTTSYDKQPKEGIDIIYTHFQRTFDSVQHKRILHKLSVYAGIQGKLLN